MSEFLKLSLKDIAGAVLSGIIVAVLGYLSTVTNILSVDLNEVLNVAMLAALGSLLKALGTNSEGKFLGVSVK